MTTEIKVFSDLQALSREAAKKFISIGNQSIKRNSRFIVALAGGSTPKSLYQLLTTENFKSQIDWKKVFFFFGDERDVSPDSEESNFRAANENLLKPLQIPEENVFRWQTEFEHPAETAKKYEQSIRIFFKSGENLLPRFDLILLGMGDDGHTASLFPFTKALNETEEIAVANPVEKLNTSRLTFTFPVINNAANVIFLISGADKAATLKEVLEGEFQPLKLPSQNVKPDGNLFWLIDEKAAEYLTRANL